MQTLVGDKARDFVEWLKHIRGFLPPSMTINEAKELFLRKLDDEKTLQRKDS